MGEDGVRHDQSITFVIFTIKNKYVEFCHAHFFVFHENTTTTMSNHLISRKCELLATLLAFSMISPAYSNDENGTAAYESSPTPQANGRSVKRTPRPANSEAEIRELLDSIPETHPMRDELRQVVLKGPPDGFSARQWLELSMKFNFRSVGSKSHSSQDNSY